MQDIAHALILLRCFWVRVNPIVSAVVGVTRMLSKESHTPVTTDFAYSFTIKYDFILHVFEGSLKVLLVEIGFEEEVFRHLS